MESDTILVRHLPDVLTVDEQEDFLKHFGATHVRCFGRKGRMKHSAFAMFKDHEAAFQAVQQLHQQKVNSPNKMATFVKKNMKYTVI